MSLSHFKPYAPPAWAAQLVQPSLGRLSLAHKPTPIHTWNIAALRDLGVRWSIKRDDMTGLEASGNKVRKLEFLLAEALSQGHDCVVTVGGIQSNHCRATAAAARLVGLDAHLVLLVRDKEVDIEPGMQGNLLVERLLGANLHIVSGSDYYRYGGDLVAMNALNEHVASELRASGRKPYLIPVGGTTPLATWGYLDAVDELNEQTEAREIDADSSTPPFDHVLVTAGSGGTVSGLALGMHLSRARAKLHAVCIHHEPEHFYQVIEAEATALGVEAAEPRDWVSIYKGAGAGYGVAQPEVLSLICDVARDSGVLLDHVYTAKCLHYFCEHAQANPEQFRNAHILFWHTGGAYALYSQQEALLERMPKIQVQRVRLP